MKKSIGIGKSDFKVVIKENLYYVDKTKFIKDIIDDKSRSILITRPRRFRKNIKYEYFRLFL